MKQEKTPLANEILITEFSEIYGDQVRELILSIQREEYHIPITLEDQPDLQDIQKHYQDALGNFWIALQGETVVGTIALLHMDTEQKALRKMFVDSKFRGDTTGTAKKLVETLLHWSKKKHIKKIWLGTTDQFIAAHRFYAKMGFTEIPKTDLPESFPAMELDTKFYSYHVSRDDYDEACIRKKVR